MILSKVTRHKFHTKGFNLRVAGKEQCRVEVSSRFVALENIDSQMDINRAWETIRGNIKISATESLDY
jgi:hypothetical protein